MADDLFTEYVRIIRQPLVRVTEENLLQVAAAVGATVHFGSTTAAGLPMVLNGSHHGIAVGQWITDGGTGYGGNGENPEGYIPALDAESVAQLLIDHDADRMECHDHDGKCCPAGDAHDFEHGHLHQAEVALAALLGIPMPTPKDDTDD